jgi:hypothetical protein
MSKLQSCLCVIVMTLIVSCGGDSNKNDPGPDTKALLTSGIWKMNDVSVDGVNRNDLFTNFTLTFTATGFFAAANGDPVWPLSGTWAFSSADQTTFTRSDGVEVAISDVSENELTLELTWNKTTLGGGRGSSTMGNYTFVMEK